MFVSLIRIRSQQNFKAFLRIFSALFSGVLLGIFSSFFYRWCSPAIYCEFDGFLSAFQVSRIVYIIISLLFLCKHLCWKFYMRLKVEKKDFEGSSADR